MDGSEIAGLDALSTDDTLLFRVRDRNGETEAGAPDDGDVREAILLLLAPENGESPAERVVCWLNYCQHYTHIKLDKGSGAPVRDGEVVCANHGAMFDADSGVCTFGPCEGAYLAEVDVTVENGTVYLTDDRYGYVGPGPVETDPTDLSSTSNLEF
ncbi:MAG: Rieske (2Fe-2S) protein [Haloarculaceae archaeon]